MINKNMNSPSEYKKRKQNADLFYIDGPEFYMTEHVHPFAKLTPTERKKRLFKMKKDAQKKNIEILNYVNKMLQKYEPFTLIASLAVMTQTRSITVHGSKLDESDWGISQTNVEILQALILRLSLAEFGRIPPTLDIVQELFAKLRDLNRNVPLSRIDISALDASDKDNAITNLQESMRGYIQFVRNWGSLRQTIGIVKGIYSHFDQLMLDNKLGFTASNVIDTFTAMIKVIETRLSKLPKNYELHQVAGVYKFSRYVLADFIKQDKLIVDRILKYMSLPLGALSQHSEDSFFLNNPIWSKPVIALQNEYYCPHPQMFFSFVLSILDDMLEPIVGDRLYKRKSVCLEKKIENIVKTRFSNAQTFTGLKWNLNGEIYETDLITVIDSHLIIIEAKAQKISREAWRGAPDRLKRNIKDILIKPSAQSYRLEQYLKECVLQKQLKQELNTQLPINIDKIQKVIRVSISLEHFALLQSNLRLLLATGWMKQESIMCLPMNVTDLEVLFDLLEHPVQIIHYLQRRVELQPTLNWTGSELDFMGLYMKTQLDITNPNSEANDQVIMFGYSESINEYYSKKERGLQAVKPQPEICPLFKSIILRLEKRNPARWTEMGVILNRFPYKVQCEITEKIVLLTKEVNETWQELGYCKTLIYTPLKFSEYALGIVLFKDGNFKLRYQFINGASRHAFQIAHVHYCLVIAINIDRNNAPYHVLALLDRSPTK